MILVVDDHADTCEALEHLFRRRGIEVRCAESGSAAVEFLIRHTPRLILLDVMTPDMSGIDLLKLIRSNRDFDATPVIMYSADFQYERWDEAKRLGAQDYLVKGTIGFDALLDRVQSWLPRADLLSPGDLSPGQERS